jgi:lipoprotein-anchoring transpeptidase ErfK/SrfK
VIGFLFHFMTKLSGSRVHLHAALLLLSILLSGCVTDNRHRMVVSVADQKMIVLRDGKPISDYPVSTSKFGVGDTPGSYATPLGVLRVKEKIGHGLALGTVFKSRQPTGEVLPINAPGRDPIVTRILWLEGLDDKNRNAYRRYIYIHGTPEERNIGRPVSYGCIRMKSKDVIELFDTVGLNSKLLITPNPLPPTLTMAVPQRNTRNLSPSR